MKIFTQKYVILIISLLFIILPLFVNLGKSPIQLWDEGRNSLNALDMYWFGLSPITYYDNLPDLWNTKPPFLIWLQVISMEIFGVNEFGLRFPSAFAALLTCLALNLFLRKYLKNEVIGILAMFVLVTSNGYVEIHGTRTADYDSLLTFLLTITALFLFTFLETKRKLFIYLFFITLGFAILTKNIAAMFFTPAYALYIIYRKQLIPLLKNKDFYFAFAIFLVIVGGFYALREYLSPGYIQAVMNNELGGRFNAITDGEPEKPTLYYLQNLVIERKRYLYWIVFLIVGIIVGITNKNKKIVRLSVFSFLLISIQLLVISIAKTKYPWYDTPIYPFAAIITSIALYTIYEWVRVKTSNKYFAFIFLFIVIGIAYSLILYKVAFERSSEYHRNNNLLSLYFKEVVDGDRHLEPHVVICTEKHQYNAEFYINQLLYKGYKIEFIDWQDLKYGQTLIMGHDDNLKKTIEKNYDFILLEKNQSDWEHWGLVKYKILNRK